MREWWIYSFNLVNCTIFNIFFGWFNSIKILISRLNLSTILGRAVSLFNLRIIANFSIPEKKIISAVFWFSDISWRVTSRLIQFYFSLMMKNNQNRFGNFPTYLSVCQNSGKFRLSWNFFFFSNIQLKWIKKHF